MRIGGIKRTKADFARYSRLYDGENWMYVFDEHKTEQFVGERVVAISLEAQEILTSYIAGRNEDLPVFSKIKKRGFGKPFTVEEHGRYVKRAIDKHGLPKFVLYQVRHTGLSQTSLDSSRDIARAVGGHTTETMTARYDHSDPAKIMAYAREQNIAYRARKAVGGGQMEYPTGVTALRIFSGE